MSKINVGQYQPLNLLARWFERYLELSPSHLSLQKATTILRFHLGKRPHSTVMTDQPDPPTNTKMLAAIVAGNLQLETANH
jgi:hypothetical protein